MLFDEAVKELVKGNYVTRCAWEAGSFLALLPGMPYAWQVKTVPNPAAGNWPAMMADYLADDWKLVCKGEQEAKEEPKADEPNLDESEPAKEDKQDEQPEAA